MEARRIGSQTYGLFQDGNGFARFALAIVHQTQIGVDANNIGVEGQGFLELFNGLIVAAVFGVGHGQGAAVEGDLRVALNPDLGQIE